MTPDELLDRAADEMMIRGSCTGKLRTDDGQVCMIGAVQEAFLSKGDVRLTLADEQAFHGAMVTLTTTLEAPNWSPNVVAEWNDTHTHDERVEALRQGAKYYREHNQSQQEAL